MVIKLKKKKKSQCLITLCLDLLGEGIPQVWVAKPGSAGPSYVFNVGY